MTLSFSFGAFSFAQQIGNADFELWENVDEGQEPVNWNSFITAQGAWSAFGGEQVASSSDVRPGSAGTKSARVWSNDVIGTLANGNLTLGIINMGSTTPSSSSNYNISLTSNANFSEAFTASPDSLVFWVKFVPASGNTTDSARVKATIHDAYDYRDPEDAASTPHVVATAVKNYGKTNNAWIRMSIPFNYDGAASVNAFMLITFTTNKTPGGGSDNDQIWIDDLQMIYNPGPNQQMTANDDNFSGSQDTDIVCDVLANDTDPENMINATSVVIFTSPTNGTVDVDAITGIVTYTPNSGYSGSDLFTYQVCDGGSPQTCDQATVNINVNFVGLSENTMSKLQVKSFGNNLVFGGMDKLDGNYAVYNLTGELVQKGKLASQVAFTEKSGVYLVTVVTSSGTITKRIYKN